MRRGRPARLGPLAVAVVGWALVAAGCSRGVGRGPALDVGAQSYRAGEPAFVLEAVATVRDGATGVDVFLGVPRASLVFRPTGDSLEAVARWTVVLTPEDSATPQTRSPIDTLREASAGAVRQPGPVWRRLRFSAPPGRYRVVATLEDRTSEQTAERTAVAEVFAPDARPALGALRLEAAGGGGTPVDPAAVPAGADSLRAVVQATAVPDRAATVLTVVRFRSDDRPATPPTDFTPAPGTLARRGVDPAQTDTVQAVRQTVLGPDGVLDVEAPLPALTPGVYAVRLDLEAPDGTPFDTADRVVVVRRTGYPALTRLGDLVEPLVYLADRREWARLDGAGSPSARRRAFDRFWGERMDDRRLAAATVRAFYDRVEEANRLFATYKDGWKTDPGMIYVLFGPPRYVEATLDGERWSYGSGGAAPPTVTFERTAGRPGETAPFRVLTLVRDRGYSEAWERARRQWRSGVVP